MLETQVGPDLRNLLHNAEFRDALRSGTFYRQHSDELFQVSGRAVMFGYRPRSSSWAAPFRRDPFPAGTGGRSQVPTHRRREVDRLNLRLIAGSFQLSEPTGRCRSRKQQVAHLVSHEDRSVEPALRLRSHLSLCSCCLGGARASWVRRPPSSTRVGVHGVSHGRSPSVRGR